MLKQQSKKLALYSSGFVLYEYLLTWVYPEIAENPALTQIVDSIPHTVKTVFGVSQDAEVDTFEAFISGQFFSRIWVMLMALYNIEAANELIAKQVEEGSLAFILSTPVPREEIFTTQAFVLLTSNALLVTATLGGLYHGANMFDISMDWYNYLVFALLGMSFFSFIGAYSLLASACFCSEEKTITYAAGATLLFYALDVLGALNKNLSWLREFSIFKWFKAQEIMEGTHNPAGAILKLSLGAASLLHLGNRIFKNKDLVL